MPMTHDEAAEHIEAWAIGALDAEEARAFEAHMDNCAECPPVVDPARETAALIAMTVGLQKAPPTLKAELLASVTSSFDAPRAKSAQSWRYWPATAAAAIAIGAGFVGLGIYSQNEANNLRDQRSTLQADATADAYEYATVSTQLIMTSDMNEDLVASHDAMAEIVAQPDAQRLTLSATRAAPASTGRYVWSAAAGIGSLVARGLPPLAEGKKYCLWFVYENDWISGGLFSVDDDGNGRLFVRELDVDGDAGALTGFSVTVEDDETTVEHTGDTVLEAKLQP
jgi:hypothetical protein